MCKGLIKNNKKMSLRASVLNANCM